MSYMYWHAEELLDLGFSCYRPAWTQKSYPTCNGFHELLDLSRDYDTFVAENNMDSYWVSRGFYRDVWVYVQQQRQPARAIFKTTRIHFNFDYRNLYGARQEALVMERLSAFSQIIDIYGYCGASVMIEPVPYEVEEYVVPGTGYRTKDDTLNSGDSPLSMNKLTPKEKLETALEMAESIAILHGYQDGVIVHDDVQLQQWLRAEDGSLKLGDFNRATILEWDANKQQYCRYSNGAAFGNVSPLFAGRYE